MTNCLNRRHLCQSPFSKPLLNWIGSVFPLLKGPKPFDERSGWDLGTPKVATPPPLGPKCPGVSPKAGVSEGQSVQKEPRKCPPGGTLFGHSGDRGRLGYGEVHPFGHSLGHPRFRGHLQKSLRVRKGPRDSCSRSGGLHPQSRFCRRTLCRFIEKLSWKFKH